jgi:hypothetical protein
MASLSSLLRSINEIKNRLFNERGELKITPTELNKSGAITGVGTSKITVATTAPSEPKEGDLWIDIS